MIRSNNTRGDGIPQRGPEAVPSPRARTRQPAACDPTYWHTSGRARPAPRRDRATPRAPLAPASIHHPHVAPSRTHPTPSHPTPAAPSPQPRPDGRQSPQDACRYHRPYASSTHPFTTQKLLMKWLRGSNNARKQPATLPPTRAQRRTRRKQEQGQSEHKRDKQPHNHPGTYTHTQQKYDNDRQNTEPSSAPLSQTMALSTRVCPRLTAPPSSPHQPRQHPDQRPSPPPTTSPTPRARPHTTLPSPAPLAQTHKTSTLHHATPPPPLSILFQPDRQRTSQTRAPKHGHPPPRRPGGTPRPHPPGSCAR